MLTADLVDARTYKGAVKPRWIDPTDEAQLALASELVETFETHVGQTRADLDEALDDILGTGTAYVRHRGLVKLLQDRSTFDTVAGAEPEKVREAVFGIAARHRREDARFDRAAVLEEAASALDLEPTAVDGSLYADLKDEQVLQAFDAPKPAALLHRYNTALAQGVLLRATELEIGLRGGDPLRHRALFRKIKFHQLLHTIHRDGDGFRIRLDGPMSLFRSSGRYGVQMASFLPTLLHFESWELEAAVRWGKRRRKCTFTLDPTTGLVPTGRLTGQWRTDELLALPGRLQEIDPAWSPGSDGEIIPLGEQGILVPDFVFVHDDGTEVAVEVLGYWRKGAVKSRLRDLRRHGPSNLVVAISGALAAAEDDDLGDLPGEVVVYRRTLDARRLRAALERVRD